jgi:hypothetical protein
MPLTCLNRGAEMRLTAFITEPAPIERILSHISEPPRPPPIAPAPPGAAQSCFAWVPARTHPALKPVFDALQGQYNDVILCCVRARIEVD